MSRKLISRDEGERVRGQHRSPCSDCPFRRDALKGWLGGSTPAEFLDIALGDSTYGCHVKLGAQCAGMAIFRANVCKSPRDPRALHLPSDKTRVFAWPAEFLAHHQKKGGATR